MFSEELVDPSSSHSVRLQQLAQTLAFDLIVSLPSTPGSLAEVHDFAADPRVSAKILAFVNQEHLNGYSSQSLQAISSLLSCHVTFYPNERDTQIIIDVSLAQAQRIREAKYIMAGRL